MICIIHGMTARKQRAPQPLKTHPILLTADDADILADLKQACRDAIGRGISSIVIIRSLLRLYQDKKMPLENLREEIEREIASGRIWGTRKGGRRHKQA